MTDPVAAGDAKLIVGSFYWVKRYGESGLTIGQLCSAGGSRRHWLIVGDEQDIYWTEITVISGPLQEPAPMTDTSKTIRARIKIAVWPDGSWTAYGDHTKSAERTMNELIDAAPGGESWHWIEADVPLPATIEGDVVP